MILFSSVTPFPPSFPLRSSFVDFRCFWAYWMEVCLEAFLALAGWCHVHGSGDPTFSVLLWPISQGRTRSPYGSSFPCLCSAPWRRLGCVPRAQVGHSSAHHRDPAQMWLQGACGQSGELMGNQGMRVGWWGALGCRGYTPRTPGNQEPELVGGFFKLTCN